MTKGLEALERIDTGQDKDCFDIIRKELKALEIIKKKEVNIYDLKEYGSKYEYNKHTNEEFQELFEEEYNLIKEVLEDD